MFIIFSMTSCERIEDVDGNLLHDMGANQGGLTGPRFLYQEYNSIDTLAHYSYDGIKMIKVVAPLDSATTDIVYNGDMINQIKYNACDGDSISYTQFFTYDTNATNIVKITELRSVFPDVHNSDPIVEEKYKFQYDLSYNSNTNKLEKITQISGQETAGTTFQFTSYRTITYEYDANNINVIKATVENGPYVQSTATFGPFDEQIIFSYNNYDDKIIPYSLLPFGYKITKTLSNPMLNYWFSENNPEEISFVTDTMPIPVVIRTNYTYDQQDYALSGFNILYDYRPF